jgi:hypothetical protein
MVDAMSIPDAAEHGEAREEADRQSPVNEPIVHDHVADPEQGHAGAGADRDRRKSSVQIAANHDERSREGRMRRRERVVRLEASLTMRMMRPMDAPERVMPHAAVEQAGPGLHRHGDRERNGNAEQHELRGRHEVTP